MSIKMRPIAAFVGYNGSGKTLSAVRQALIDGRPIVTNVPAVRGSTYVTSLDEVMAADYTDADIVLDEVGVWFSARQRNQDERFLALVQQLRKSRTRLLWTAPSYARADKVLREVTQLVVKCSAPFPGKEPGSPWPRARWIYQQGFDAIEFEDVGLSNLRTDRSRRGPRRAGRSLFPASKYFDAFDSFHRIDQKKESSA